MVQAASSVQVILDISEMKSESQRQAAQLGVNLEPDSTSKRPQETYFA